MSQIQKDKWVRIMADYCADGVWQKDGAGTTADDLPVPSGLIERLRTWQRKFDGDDQVKEPEFSLEGLLIAKEIKGHLPDWTIVYFDNAAVERLNPQWDVEDRSGFEYEVHG